jgi:hypothetical protein
MPPMPDLPALRIVAMPKHPMQTWWPLGVGIIIKMANAPINNQSTPHTTIANLHRIPARSSGLNDPLLNPVAEQEQ